jgi:hypothetical protein
LGEVVAAILSATCCSPFWWLLVARTHPLAVIADVQCEFLTRRYIGKIVPLLRLLRG